MFCKESSLLRLLGICYSSFLESLFTVNLILFIHTKEWVTIAVIDNMAQMLSRDIKLNTTLNDAHTHTCILVCTIPLVLY